jgi:hypothetical protein
MILLFIGLFRRWSNDIERIGRKDPRPNPFPPAAFLVRASSALNRWLLFGAWDGPLVIVIVELAYPRA